MPVAKYPRTPHLPYSETVSRDEKRWLSAAQLVGREVVLTEKLDGSGVCLAGEGLYARSRASGPTHPSFAALWPVWAEVRNLVEDEHLSIFGEWAYAVHSVWYPRMQPENWLSVIGVRDERDGSWWGWHEVEALAEKVGVPTVPVDEYLVVETEDELKARVRAAGAKPSRYGPEREGVVVRTVAGFGGDEFGSCVAKWVRAGHVAGEHWSRQTPRRHDRWSPEEAGEGSS